MSPQPPDDGSPLVTDAPAPDDGGVSPASAPPVTSAPASSSPAPLPGNGLQLLFPFAGRELSEQNRVDLRGFLSQIPVSQNRETVLVIEGRAYADEAPTEAAVKSLADERMRLVQDFCLEQGIPVNLVPVSAVKEPAAAEDVVGVALYFIRRSDK